MNQLGPPCQLVSTNMSLVHVTSYLDFSFFLLFINNSLVSLCLCTTMTNEDTIDLENNNVESNSTPSMAADVETSSAPTNTHESQYDENLKKKIKLTSLA